MPYPDGSIAGLLKQGGRYLTALATAYELLGYPNRLMGDNPEHSCPASKEPQRCRSRIEGRRHGGISLVRAQGNHLRDFRYGFGANAEPLSDVAHGIRLTVPQASCLPHLCPAPPPERVGA